MPNIGECDDFNTFAIDISSRLGNGQQIRELPLILGPLTSC